MIVEFINGIEFGFQQWHNLYSVDNSEILDKSPDMLIFKLKFPIFRSN